jgi:error-prone DNA polymerase
VVPSDALPRHDHGTTVEVAGLVVARQRPETAKGYIFVLLEDEVGMVNVIVRPEVFQAHRAAIRGEPLLWVQGTLAKDDGTLNVLAERIEALRVPRDADRAPAAPPEEPARSPYAFLKSMRRVAPDSKDWG